MSGEFGDGDSAPIIHFYDRTDVKKTSFFTFDTDGKGDAFYDVAMLQSGNTMLPGYTTLTSKLPWSNYWNTNLRRIAVLSTNRIFIIQSETNSGGT